MKTLTQILKHNPGYSEHFRKIADLNLTGVPLADRPLQILNLILLIELTEKLGWAEHTSDWDLYLQINGDLCTIPGYTDITFLDKDNQVLEIKDYVNGLEPLPVYCMFGKDAESEEDYEELIFPIAEIKTITLDR